MLRLLAEPYGTLEENCSYYPDTSINKTATGWAVSTYTCTEMPQANYSSLCTIEAVDLAEKAYKTCHLIDFII